jgi:hypothetical protein
MSLGAANAKAPLNGACENSRLSLWIVVLRQASLPLNPPSQRFPPIRLAAVEQQWTVLGSAAEKSSLRRQQTRPRQSERRAMRPYSIETRERGLTKEEDLKG